jgi:hypothetical protein
LTKHSSRDNCVHVLTENNTEFFLLLPNILTFRLSLIFKTPTTKLIFRDIFYAVVSIRNIPFNFFLNVGYAFFWRKNSVRYSRVCDSYHNFLDKGLLFECFTVATVTWENVPEYLYHKWPYIYICSVWRNHKPSFPHSWLIEFQTATKRRMPLVEQEPTLPVLIPF